MINQIRQIFTGKIAMKNILIVSTVGMGYEGISSVIYNYASTMNADGIRLHFVAYEDTDKKLISRFQKRGSVFCVHNRKCNTKAYINDLIHILAGKYDVVHIHGNSGTMAIEAVLAKLYHVKKIIVHCHNTSCNHKYLNMILKFPMRFCATNLVACSEASGKWLYGKRMFIVLNNAVDMGLFRYNKEKREYLRRKYGLGTSFVIGHSGRFHEQKNHDFLIDIFAAYLEKDSGARLLLTGGGALLEKVRSKVRHLGLEDSVMFTGELCNACEIYNAMDLFLLPSLWEGLPLVMIEAQANGLPLLVSDVITQEACCTERTFYFDLNRSAEEWADRIHEIRESAFDHSDNVDKYIKDRGFDIKDKAEALKNIYII